MLEKMQKVDDLINVIKANCKDYPSILELYLFGSYNLNVSFPNDVDILVVYMNDARDIRNELDKLEGLIYLVTGLNADITPLSKNEMTELKFLNRLNNNYLKIL